uniref:BZIP domain-containing protein n=1 Tax=Haptolina brevifila TaxID=156173 RepID=A0A7S2D9H6_9EUKA|mmetsp:Transcript_34877/g.69610  ORF Transcript_34877/g.69610 Transcript_34877/m.69610 type:complete len:468 (+) Transcript_34877:45-1448(+)|eukprot:CAMPEP_0174726250 /NCGR_PEP_ID=MMETSP1094-20130205/47340_1 /TAXON_ID=156173 /ORGANISM="Chrysochromulina brevifilum, Strain UTEX LB 985" /LENGTH=467 /DNA_ID=CAMNT_0015927781 /DNA_START=45 /DNA_END=1448 /DNA_ORIENTATION=+
MHADSSLPDVETRALECVSMSELESIVPELESLSSIDAMLQRSAGENAWVCFEADVRSAAAIALDRLRGQGSERCAELLRLCEFEEQTRCQAFQATMMGEVGPAVYQATVNSIIEKLLGKLETWEPIYYQATTQCLSDYMSALNHHCNICAVPSRQQLPAIAEGRETDMVSDAIESSDYPSGSEEADWLSVHSEGGGAYVRRISTGDLPSAGFAQGFSQGALTVLGGHLAMGGGTVSIAGGTPMAGLAAGGMTVSSAAVPMASGSAGGWGASSASEEEARKERRRESNKKASVKYRSKKAGSVHQIVAELATARQQVSALTSQVAVLSAENQLLKQQVAFLQGVMQGQQPSLGSTPALAPMPAQPAQPPPASDAGNLYCAASGSTFVPPAAALPADAPLATAPLLFSAQSAPAPAFSTAPAPASAPSALAGAAFAGAVSSAQHFPGTDCGTGCGVSEWLTADANLRI